MLDRITPTILCTLATVAFGATPMYADITEKQVTQKDTATSTPVESAPSKAIHISLASQRLFLLEDDVVIYTYPVSTGAPRTPTPQGTFAVHRKQDLRISKQEIPYRMPYYLSITKNGAYGIHALPYLGSSAEASTYWHEALDHIGTPVSHGCIRLLPEDALALYEWAELEMPVYIAP